MRQLKLHPIGFKSATATATLSWLICALVLFVSIWATPVMAKQLSKTDIKNAKSVFKAIDRNRFKDALKLTQRIKNKDLVRVLVWKYLTAHNTPAKYDDIKPFVERYEGWPDRKAMLKRAEETMPSKLSAAEIMAWFDQYGGPISTMGRVRKAQAQEKLGLKDVADAEVRKIWVEGNFTKRQEKNFYRKHRKIITKQDHIDRLERLIWSERYWPAQRQLWKVDKKTRKLAIARIWLMKEEGNVDKAIAELKKTAPELIDHPGLIYERLRWRRRKGRTEGAAELLRDAQGDPMRPDKWWKERTILARTLLQKDKPKQAYDITSAHGLTHDDAAEYSDAEWMSGWIALTFLKDPKRAYQHFQNMLGAVSFPVSVARGSYWSGRAAQALGQTENGKKWLNRAAVYPNTYYGQLARARLGQSVVADIPLPVPTQAETQAFNNHVLKRTANLLAEMGLRDRLRPFLTSLAADGDTPGWKRLSAAFAESLGRPDLAIRITKKSEQAGMALGRLGYPMLTPPAPKNGAKVETPLVLAVIRQESQFFTTAKSHAGARGLMQVMPATAKKVAKANRMPYSRSKLQKDPNYNLVIGQMYLADMVKNYDGSYPMALAAYNAGPHRVNRWVRTFGDPRKDDTDIIDWVEMIPYSETRNYVQRVLENLGVYRAQLKQPRVAVK
ncbi:MAG: lytic transglycosylase domain-containing protein [Magnetovibrio sp.]|nr:lytic transglycosylase domain-containing protein [Magnetovibrio sp.]